MHTPFHSQWRWRPLLACHLLAIALLGSWLLPVGHGFWHWVDEQAFFMLNGRLADNPGAPYLWALLNTRGSDLLPALVMLASLTLPFFGIRQPRLHGAFVGLLLTLVVMFLVRRALHHVAGLYDWGGPSPSLVLEPVHLLSELVPHINAKESANDSFPGDHAAVLWVWCGYLIVGYRRLSLLWTVPVAIFFMLPRLTGGAHWLSDVVVGGGFTALITLGWVFYSPLLYRVTERATVLFSGLVCAIGRRFTALQRLAFFRPGESAPLVSQTHRSSE